MYLIIKNNQIKIKSDFRTLKNLQKLFIFPDYSYCWMYGKFNKNRIIQRKLLKINGNNAILPIGFLSELEDYLIKNDIPIYNINDLRKKKFFLFDSYQIKNSLHYLELYDYQIKAVQTCIKKINCIIKLPTSAGKTEIFLSFCKLTKLKTLILFNRIDLANQTKRRAKKANLDVGIVQGNNIDENHTIVMCTIQSAKKLQNKYDCIIVDECHRAAGEQYQQLLKKHNFVYRLGFSATPFSKNKLKNAKVKQYLGKIEYTLPASHLIKKNKIAKPTIYFTKIKKPYNLIYKKWRKAEELGIIENDYRNNIIKNICENKTGQTLILVKRIKHGEILNNMISNSIFLYGNINTEKRMKITAKFESGEKFILIASSIFDEGISINNINNLIIAGGGKSNIKTIQRIGRGLRINKNKNTVKVFDFLDIANKYLERHSKERYETYIQEGFTNIKEEIYE